MPNEEIVTRTALWLRFDIPYAEEATIMRAHLAFREGHSIRTIALENLPDIPLALERAMKTTTEQKITIGPEFTLVYPLDSRHGVAWAVKEEADKHSFQFSRHIPPDAVPDVEAYPGFAEITGSPEDKLSRDDSRALVMRLNAEAQEFFSTGMDLPDAMSSLRHALQVASARLGWNDPAMVYALRNFGYVMRATGNDENLAEFLCLSRILAVRLTSSPAAPGTWDADNVGLLEQTAGLCATSGDEETGRKLMEYKAKIGT